MSSPSQRCLHVLLVGFSVSCLVLGLRSAEALATDMRVETRLIWGTNDEQSPEPKHKSIDTPLTQRLAKVFTWRNYFEVNRKEASITLNATRKFELSEKCHIEVKNLGNTRVEVKLFGSGKLLSKTLKVISTGDWFVLAGPCRNKTAWFVVLKTIEPESI